MTSLAEILSEYFDDKNTHTSSDMKIIKETWSPIRPTQCSWEIHQSPERFSKTFKFQSRNEVSDFISEVLKYENACNHAGTQKISGLEVIIDVYTHDVNKITELDQEYTKQIDWIHRDVLDFER